MQIPNSHKIMFFNDFYYLILCKKYLLAQIKLIYSELIMITPYCKID